MDKVTLRPITLSDTDLIVRWRNSDAVRLNMYDQRILTPEQHRDYFHNQIKTGKITQYIICAGKIPIGTIFFKCLDSVNVEIGLFVGEKEYRRKGCGTQALNLLLEKLRNSSYKSVHLKVISTNTPAIMLYLGAGFECEKIKSSECFLKMTKKF